MKGKYMKHNGIAPRYQRMLKSFTHLPQQMLMLHEVDNVTEYVLHSLCDEDCLDLSKAAYFIDNPDFDCLKGIAGFNKEDDIHTCNTVLSNHQEFNDYVGTCEFNKQERNITVPSAHRRKDSEEKIVLYLAGLLGIANPAYYHWNVKHGNHGLLIFEQDEQEEQSPQEFLTGLTLLGFCPVS